MICNSGIVFEGGFFFCLCTCPPVQVLAYSVACVGVSAFSGGLIDAAKAEEVMNTLRTLTEESQQVSRKESLVRELVSGGLAAASCMIFLMLPHRPLRKCPETVIKKPLLDVVACFSIL